MSGELIGVLVGGVIGIVGSLATTLIITCLSNRRRSRAIRALARAEVTAIKERAQRYIDELSDKEELSASTPMLPTIASELGFLGEEEVVAFRRAVTLAAEMSKQGTQDKAKLAIKACEDTLRCLGG